MIVNVKALEAKLENLTFHKATRVCSRCKGQSILIQHLRIQNGICYKCEGVGKVLTKKQALENEMFSKIKLFITEYATGGVQDIEAQLNSIYENHSDNQYGKNTHRFLEHALNNFWNYSGIKGYIKLCAELNIFTEWNEEEWV